MSWLWWHCHQRGDLEDKKIWDGAAYHRKNWTGSEKWPFDRWWYFCWPRTRLSDTNQWTVKKKGLCMKDIGWSEEGKSSFSPSKNIELKILPSWEYSWLIQVKGCSRMKKDAMATKWKEVFDSQKNAPICSKCSAMVQWLKYISQNSPPG